MGFLDFLKKKQEIIEKEKIRFDELEQWLKTEKAKIETAILKQINSRTSQFIKEIEQEISFVKMNQSIHL